MRTLAAFAVSDFRNIQRDALLFYILLQLAVQVFLSRWVVYSFTPWLLTEHGFDLTPYYPLIVGILLTELPLMFGLVFGLLLLDERDDSTLIAIRVTPVSMASYMLYRTLIAFVGGGLYLTLAMPLTGLLGDITLVELAPIAFCAALLGPLMSFVLAAFARNKVEGLALLKACGILLFGVVAAYFVEGNAQLLLGILPGYWMAKAYWSALAGEVWWPYILVGAAYTLLLMELLRRRFFLIINR